MMKLQLLSVNNSKLKRGEHLGYISASLELVPHKLNGLDIDLCSGCSTATCRQNCIVGAGNGRFDVVFNKRKQRALMYIQKPAVFKNLLQAELCYLSSVYQRVAVRLNTFSDIDWRKDIRKWSRLYPNITFYDYTKDFSRKSTNWYHLTFSYNGSNKKECIEKLRAGFNVAIPFKSGLPKEFWGFPVIDGDEHDLRFLDLPGSVVGLKAKTTVARTTKGSLVKIKRRNKSLFIE